MSQATQAKTTTYNYVTFRYMADPVREEFVNLGLIMMADDNSNFLNLAFLQCACKIQTLFGDEAMDDERYEQMIEPIVDELTAIAKGSDAPKSTEQLAARVMRSFPNLAPNLFVSDMRGGTLLNATEDDVIARFEELYTQLVDLPAEQQHD